MHGQNATAAYANVAAIGAQQAGIAAPPQASAMQKLVGELEDIGHILGQARNQSAMMIECTMGSRPESPEKAPTTQGDPSALIGQIEVRLTGLRMLALQVRDNMDTLRKLG